jgi:hypothetical protein
MHPCFLRGIMQIGFRTVLSFLLCVAASTLVAQGGVRAIVYDFENLTEGNSISQQYGIGYDHDLNERLSTALAARMGPNSYMFNYRSAYHFSDNDRGSFYMGPSVGVRKFRDDGPLLVPVGMQVGVRGGLERFYADLYAGFRYNIGNGQATSEPGVPEISVVPVGYYFGLGLGWGWAGGGKKGTYR